MSLSNEKGSKRADIRTNTDLEIKMKVINDRDWHLGRMVNLSRSGACVEGIPALKVGAAIEMLVSLKDPNKHYSILAHVVWCDGDRTGLRFLYAP